MTLQLIQKQPFIFRANNIEYLFVKPKFLYKNCNLRIAAVVKGSTLGWNIGGEFLSFNKLKKEYEKNKFS